VSSSVSVFLDEEASPRVSTNPGSRHPFEVVVIGNLTIYVSGEDPEYVDFWDRMRRACIEAGDRAQRRMDARKSLEPDTIIRDVPPTDTPLALEDDKAGEEA